MRRSILEMQQGSWRGDRRRRVRRRRPTVELLEARALLSTVPHPGPHGHALAVHQAKKAGGGYQQINLVSDLPGAQLTDSNLKNPWGMAYSTSSPFWISDAGSGVSSIYSVSPSNAVTNMGSVKVPGASAGSTGSPTGQVFNNTSSFTLANGKPVFIFDTLQGTVAAWNMGSGTTAQTVHPAENPPDEYTGLAIGSSGGKDYIYTANTHENPGIDVYDTSFNKVTLAGNFVDPKLKKGFAKKLTAFNIQNIGGLLYVTYATPYPGFKGGAVAVFNPDGTFVRQIAFNGRAGKLAAPWGVTMAPASFGKFSGDLLVGNFGNGRINAYNAKGKFVGQLTSNGKKPIVIPGLWALGVGNGQKAGATSAVYFTAGINNLADGLFGALQSTT